jgi:ABC-type ATPase involved in cell division
MSMSPPMISASFDSGIRGSPLRGGKPAGGSGKSWTFATVLITRAAERRLRILVADELVAEYTARRVGVVRRRLDPVTQRLLTHMIISTEC